jgi:hypothetical protein
MAASLAELDAPKKAEPVPAAPSVPETKPAAAKPAAEAEPAPEAKPTGPAPKVLDLEKYGDQVVDIVVDGRKLTVPLRELVDGAQLKRAAQIRMQEAAELRKRAPEEARKAIIDDLRKTPAQFLGQLGEDAIRQTIRDLVSANDPAIAKAVEAEFEALTREQQMSPEERLEKRARELEQRERQWNEQRERERLEATAAQVQPVLSQSFEKALQAQGIEPSPEVMAQMIDLGLRVTEQGAELTADVITHLAMRVAEAEESRRGKYLGSLAEAPPEVVQRYVTPRLATMTPQEIAKLVGEEKLKELRAWDLERVRGAAAAPRQSERQASAPAPEKPARPLTMEEAREKLRQSRMQR